MTVTWGRSWKYGDISRTLITDDRSYALCPTRRVILTATREDSGQMNLAGESAEFSFEPKAFATDGTHIFVVGATGIEKHTDAASPVYVSTFSFDGGKGKFLFIDGDYIIAPFGLSGVQVLTKAGVQVANVQGILSTITAASYDADNGHLWVVDEDRAKAVSLEVSATGQLSYMQKFPVSNCRDIARIVFDSEADLLFVICKHRIISFDTTDWEYPVVSEDYGKKAITYTDFVKIDTDSYWIGTKESSVSNAMPFVLGVQYGSWDADNEEMQIACPGVSLWTVTNVVPYFGVDDIGDIDIVPPEVVVPPPPSVVLPDAPVITSSLVEEITEGETFSYTITATGAGPILYGVTSPPSWLTGINQITGAISGVPTVPGEYSITITATNDGGTDTETIVLTVVAALYADLTAISANSQVRGYAKSGNLVYFVGAFTTVTDRNGTYTRNRAACLDMSTGLWTSWDPNCSTTMRGVVVGDGIYLICDTTTHTVGGQSRGRMSKVSTSGTVQSFNPSFDSSVNAAIYYGGTLYVFGAFATVDSQTRWAACAFGGDTLSSWELKDAGSGNKVAAWNSTSFPGQISAAGISGGALCYTGIFQIAKSGGGTMQHTYGKANVSTGQPAQMDSGNQASNAQGTSGYCGSERDGTFRWPQTVAATLSSRSLPTGIPTYFTARSFGSLSGGTSLDTISEDLTPTFGGSPNFYVFSKLDSGKYLIGGSWSSVSGDTTIRGGVVVSSTGTVDSSFTHFTRGNAAWQTAVATNYPRFGRIEKFGGQEVAIWLGAFGNISTQTYDGTPVLNMLFFNPNTGARL